MLANFLFTVFYIKKSKKFLIMINSTSRTILLTKPITKMPKGLIYKSKLGDYYRLIETKTGKYVGSMRAFPIFNDKSYYDNYGINDSVFYISHLEIESKFQQKGWGTYFIDFAKKECINQNCGNRVSLVAYNFENSPHAFYYKQGFVTLDERTNKILAEYVKNHWIPFHWDAMEMYLPEKKIDFSTLENVKTENIFIHKIKSILKFLRIC